MGPFYGSPNTPKLRPSLVLALSVPSPAPGVDGTLFRLGASPVAMSMTASLVVLGLRSRIHSCSTTAEMQKAKTWRSDKR